MIPSACIVLLLLAGSGEHHVAPLVEPGAITVDGDLSDWADVPNAVQRRGRDAITFAPDAWHDEADLGATLRIAWSERGIHIAADVVDDQVPSKQTDWRVRHGDHVALWLDAIPMTAPPPTPDEGQSLVVFSPGRFDGHDQPPSVYIYRPTGEPHAGEIAAKATEGGYVIEGFIPFERLGIDPPSVGDDVNFELAVCDSDHAWNEWRTMVTVGREPFTSARSRLLPLVFGDAQGQGAAPLREVRFADSIDVAAESTSDLAAMIERLPDDKRAVLVFKSRMPADHAGGYRSKAVSVQVNGITVEMSRLLNKPAASTMADGRPVVYMDEQNRLTLAFAPDFRAADASPSYADADGYRTCDWAFDVTELLGVGDNVISFVNHVPPDEHDRTAQLADVEIRFLPTE